MEKILSINGMEYELAPATDSEMTEIDELLSQL